MCRPDSVCLVLQASQLTGTGVYTFKILLGLCVNANMNTYIHKQTHTYILPIIDSNDVVHD